MLSSWFFASFFNIFTALTGLKRRVPAICRRKNPGIFPDAVAKGNRLSRADRWRRLLGILGADAVHYAKRL